MPETPFEQAAALLPMRLRGSVMKLPEGNRAQIEELRLRTGFPISVVEPAGETEVPLSPAVEVDDLYTVLELASQSSVHTVLDRMRSGFVTVRGGHRVGLCGAAVVEQGGISGFRRLSSLNLRIAREVRGLAEAVVPALLEGGVLQSTLILAPPGAGKTTLLRDLIRCISDGRGVPPLRVGVADERGELAAVWEGVPQMDLGRHTDVLDGAPKAKALLLLLRGMNPQVLAADEITDPADVEAIGQAAGCGVALLATAHGSGVKELALRPVYRELLRQNIFRRIVLIRRDKLGGRELKVEELPCCG